MHPTVAPLIESARLTFSSDDIAVCVGVSVGTLRAWQHADFLLEPALAYKVDDVDPVHVRRLAEMERVSSLAVRKLPEREQRVAWMSRRNRDLNGASPLDAVRLYRWDLAREALLRAV